VAGHSPTAAKYTVCLRECSHLCNFAKS